MPEPFEEYPWGLPHEPLFTLSWESHGPGGGREVKVSTLSLRADVRLYLSRDVNFGDQLVAAGRTQAHERLDDIFLQHFLVTNGSCFGVDLAGSAPDWAELSPRWDPAVWVEWLLQTFRIAERYTVDDRFWDDLERIVRGAEEGFQEPEPGDETDGWRTWSAAEERDLVRRWVARSVSWEVESD